MMKSIAKWKIFVTLAPILIFLLFSASFLFGVSEDKKSSGGDEPTTSVGLSPEAERYRPLVVKYCGIEKIPDKVNILMGMLMQESGGRVPDVMQSSESLGLPVNTLTPEPSIEQGVKYFASSLASSNGDEDLAIQSYNYGKGFITWVNDGRGGKYTKELANEFSNMMAIQQGWSNYGDKEYVPHVRRYIGGTGSELPPGFAKTIMDEALKYQGTRYVFGGSNPSTGFDCSGLTQWVYGIANVTLPRTAQMQYDAMEILQNENEAKEGDLVFFKNTYPTSDFITHVGIYVGNGKMYHAGDPLGYCDISYFGDKLVGFGRLKIQ